MDQILDIQLTINGSQVTATDTTITSLPANAEASYKQHYTSIEFLTHITDDNVVENSINTEAVKEVPATYTYNLQADGIYYYYKISVPDVAYFLGKDVGSMSGEIVFDRTDHKLKQIKQSPADNSETSIRATLADIDLIGAYKATTENLGANYEANESYIFPKKIVFSSWNLRRCLLQLQHKVLFDKSDDCKDTSDLKNSRDFLLSALYVIDYLKETNNEEEAQRILDNISECNFMCGRDLKLTNDCGCGHTL